MQGQKIQNEVAGPIGIAQVTGQAAKIGPMAVLNLMSMLSLSLALLNTLPIPALDGGRVFFIVVEAITGKKVNQTFENRAHQIGMIALLFFILLVTINDLSRLFGFS
jgi:regulator of sigma E protease